MALSIPPPLPELTVEPRPVSLDSKQLFGMHSVIEITHGQVRYQLRITRENKLILTK